MNAFSGWTISVGLLLAATSANAQGTAPQGTRGYVATSDFSGPYADVAPAPRAPVYGGEGYGPQGYGPHAYGPTEYGPAYGPPLIPPREVYEVLRESGFSPLDAPRLRGMFYHIAAVDRRGDDGRLVIDARSGQIVRFVPASRFGDGRPAPYGYGGGYGYGPAPMNYPAGPPRPPLGLPKEASRTLVPVPRAAPPRAADEKTLVEKPAAEKPMAEKPAPRSMQQSASVQGKAADAPPSNPPPVIEAKPAAPAILPTQPMPKVQDFE